MTTIIVSINGNDSRHSCDTTLVTPPMKRKYAAILLAGLDAVADCLSGTTDNYDAVMKMIGPYLVKRKAEMKLPSNN